MPEGVLPRLSLRILKSIVQKLCNTVSFSKVFLARARISEVFEIIPRHLTAAVEVFAEELKRRPIVALEVQLLTLYCQCQQN